MLMAVLVSAFLIGACDKKADSGGGADSMAAAGATEGGGVEAANIALSREFIDKVISGGDTAFAREHIDPAFVEHNPSPGQDAGVNGFFQWLAMQRAAFPDMKLTINDIFAQGDKVVIRSTMTGTNTGEMMGKPPTGKPISMEVIDIVTIKNGKMTDHWGQADVMKMMTDLGLMPPQGGAPAAADTSAPAAGETKKDTAG